VATAAHERNRLMMFALRHGGRTIAMQLDLLGTQQSGFALKVAYDEEYGKFSPGVLLELDAIRFLHRERRAMWLDSCCAPTMDVNTATWMNRLWNQRRALVGAVVPAAGILPSIGFAAIPIVRCANRMVRRLAARATLHTAWPTEESEHARWDAARQAMPSWTGCGMSGEPY
jgi:hypothetical protein